MTLTLVVGLVYPNDPESYAGGSVATGRASLARQVDGEGSDKEVIQKRNSARPEEDQQIEGRTELLAVVKAICLGKEARYKPCKLGSCKVATPPPNYICAALVRRPDESFIPGKPHRINMDTPTVRRTRHEKDKRLGISEHIKVATWNVRGIGIRG